jgi:hypothetical protein
LVGNPVILTTSSDPFTRGLDYLYGVRSLALEPEMIAIVHDVDQRLPICTWIGTHIEVVNAALTTCLRACQACFHPWEQSVAQIYAAPLAQSFGLDGVCNLQTDPITILVDVGRVVPEDWLRLVVHEYAHAQTGCPGHHEQFARSLTHLCLGLGITPPYYQAGMEFQLRFHPAYRTTQKPLDFWKGEGNGGDIVLQINTLYPMQ